MKTITIYWGLADQLPIAYDMELPEHHAAEIVHAFKQANKSINRRQTNLLAVNVLFKEDNK